MHASGPGGKGQGPRVKGEMLPEGMIKYEFVDPRPEKDREELVEYIARASAAINTSLAAAATPARIQVAQACARARGVPIAASVAAADVAFSAVP